MALARELREIYSDEDVARATAVLSLDYNGVFNRDFAAARRLFAALQDREDIILLVLSKCSNSTEHLLVQSLDFCTDALEAVSYRSSSKS